MVFLGGRVDLVDGDLWIMVCWEAFEEMGMDTGGL